MGNMSDWETLLLADVPAWLERALPDGWTAEVAEAPSDRILDGLLTLRGPSGTDAIFALEAKRWTTGPTSAVVGVLAHLQRQSRYPIVLVTDHTNPPLRAACDELGMGYVDKNGWVSLRSTEPAVLIRLAGVDRRPPFGERSTAVVRLTGPSTGLIIERLLDTPAQKALGVRQLAKASGVTPGAVAKVLPALVKAGAVERDTDGRVTLVRKRLLLATWTADYQFEKTNSDITYGLQPRGMVDLVGRLASLDTGYAVTGALAATAHLPEDVVPVAPAARAMLYAGNPTAVRTRLGGAEVDRPVANLVIVRPKDLRVIQRTLRTRDGLPAVGLGRFLADLLTTPGRESLIADQVMDYLADDDPAWKQQ